MSPIYGSEHRHCQVYIVPSLLLASTATAVRRGELDQLLRFESARAAAGKREMQARREAAEKQTARDRERAHNRKAARRGGR